MPIKKLFCSLFFHKCFGGTFRTFETSSMFFTVHQALETQKDQVKFGSSQHVPTKTNVSAIPLSRLVTDHCSSHTDRDTIDSKRSQHAPVFQSCPLPMSCQKGFERLLSVSNRNTQSKCKLALPSRVPLLLTGLWVCQELKLKM